jgi:hypothetical protein
MKIPFYGRLVVVVLVVLAVSQFAPEPMNYVLLLVLIGVLLSKSEIFGNIFNQLGFS